MILLTPRIACLPIHKHNSLHARQSVMALLENCRDVRPHFCLELTNSERDFIVANKFEKSEFWPILTSGFKYSCLDLSLNLSARKGYRESPHFRLEYSSDRLI